MSEARETKHCPVCNAELPEYASYVKGVASLTLYCPECSVPIVIAKPDFEPRAIEDDPLLEQRE